MTTTPTVTTVPGGMWSATAPDAKPIDNTLGKDAFLKLLVAQMKYQDPMNPADGTEFIAQTAQFTVVEKLQEMSKQNELLLASQQSMTATGLIGRDVTWDIPDGSGSSVAKFGTVTGVSFTAGGPTLRVGGEDIPLSKVKAVAPVMVAPSTAPEAASETKPAEATKAPDAAKATDETAATGSTSPGATAPVAGSDPADTPDPAMDGTPEVDTPSPAGTDPAI